MAEGYSDTAVYDCQVSACKSFFQANLPRGKFKLIAKNDRPKNMKKFTGPVYDITGFDARTVVSVLSDIVNNKCKPSEFKWKKGKTFYLWIHSSSEDNSDRSSEEDSESGSDNSQIQHKGFTTTTQLEELFRIKASPTKDQPGNGMVVLRPRGKTKFTKEAKKYDALNGALKAHYKTNTASFAKDIKLLFKNNACNKDIPQATFEAYLILLFEIARRLVKLEKPSDKKEALDVLPIRCAIARLIKLLERGDKETCIFEDVFLPREKFHCFSGKPEKRREAINNINMATKQVNKTKKKKKKEATKKHHLEELKTLYKS